MNWQKKYQRQERYYHRNKRKIFNKAKQKRQHLSFEDREKERKYHRERRRRKRIEFLEQHKEEIQKKKEQAIIKNRKKALIRQKRWTKNHPEQWKNILKKYAKIYQKRRYWNDPKFKVRVCVSVNINCRLKSRLSSKKGKSILKFLPYTIDELMKHLEKQFKPGMSWGNYGKWQIDHIVPDSHFKYSNIEDKEFKKCWALSNLQPLWAKENWDKRDKILC